MFPRHLLLALLLIASPVLAADDVMRYPRAPAGDEFRPLYPLALLQLALDKAASDLRLEPSDYHMEQQRALLSLERGEAVDVVWTMTSIEREQRLLPVRIPLDKGLYGWRIALLRAAMCTRSKTCAGCAPAKATTGRTPPSCGTRACRWKPAPAMTACS